MLKFINIELLMQMAASGRRGGHLFYRFFDNRCSTCYIYLNNKGCDGPVMGLAAFFVAKSGIHSIAA